MADIETSVVISAQTDDLQSGMEAATNSVQAATEAMKAQFASLGAAAQQAQSQISATVAQIGTTIGTLQSKVASLAGSIGDGVIPNVAADGQGPAGSGQQRGGGRGSGQGVKATGYSGANAAGQGEGNDRLQQWRAQLQSQLLDEGAFFRDSKADEVSFWQEKLALTEAGSKARFAVESNIYQLQKQLVVQNERDALAAFDADEKVTDAAYARKKAAIQASAALGQTSSKEEIAELQGMLETKWSLEQDYFEKKFAAAENDVRTQQKLADEERLSYEKFLTERQKLDIQAVQNSERAWQSLMQPIQRAFDTSITGMILGTTTLQKGGREYHPIDHRRVRQPGGQDGDQLDSQRARHDDRNRGGCCRTHRGRRRGIGRGVGDEGAQCDQKHRYRFSAGVRRHFCVPGSDHGTGGGWTCRSRGSHGDGRRERHRIRRRWLGSAVGSARHGAPE
jgi:hypothetical protein